MSHRFVDETPFSERRRGSKPAQREKPYYGRGTGVCYHPFCSAQIWDRHPTLLLCQSHAINVWDEVDADVFFFNQLEERRGRKRFERTGPELGWVYYLEINGDIKIGYTSTLWGRMKSYPPTSKLLARHPGTQADEKALHAQFAAFRIAGREWYRPDQVLLDHINQVISEHGEPDYDIFEHRRRQPKASERQPVRLRRRSGPQGWAV